MIFFFNNMIVSLANLIAMMRQGLVINQHIRLLLTDNSEARCKIPKVYFQNFLGMIYTHYNTYCTTGTVYSLNLFHNSPLLQTAFVLRAKPTVRIKQ